MCRGLRLPHLPPCSAAVCPGEALRSHRWAAPCLLRARLLLLNVAHPEKVTLLGFGKAGLRNAEKSLMFRAVGWSAGRTPWTFKNQAPCSLSHP